MQTDEGTVVDAYGDLLDEIRPATESSRAATLEYPQFKREGFEADEGGLVAEQQEINDELIRLKRQDVKNKVKHLELLARHANDDTIPVENRQFAADEFTKLSIKLYGAPDAEIAGKILREGLTEFYAKYDDIRTLVKGYLYGKYPGLFELLGWENQRWLEAREIREVFERGLAYLKQQNVEDWGEWRVEEVDSDKLSVAGRKKVIRVGRERASEKLITVKGLFAHEVLRHARTAVNGSKIDAALGAGLPDFVAAEEGFAAINEFAITDRVPDKLVDRYVDTAADLGLLGAVAGGERRIRRPQLAEVVMERLRRRYPEKSAAEIEAMAYAHVNRIFRGTPGNEVVSGVFTKDVVYFDGFMAMLKYIRAELESGKGITEIMRFVEQGKFDPGNFSHVEYLRGKLRN
jgi:hypothetical protein